MHYWGDKDFDWDALDEAGEYLRTYFRRWRVPVRDIKEKYGTLRCYCSLGWYSPHALTHPRYIFSQYPKWLWIINCKFRQTWFWKWLIYRSSIKLHKRIYRNGYKKLIKKWPSLKVEILMDADFPELLEEL